MSKAAAPKTKDTELISGATAFAKAFKAAAIAQTPMKDFSARNGSSLGAAGVIELTDEVVETMAALRSRAMKLLGSKAGHERAIDQMLFKTAHQSIVDGVSAEAMATRLIDAVFDPSLVSYDYAGPNRLFRFRDGVKSIQIGEVRAMLTSELAAERRTTYPNDKVTIVQGDEFKMTSHGETVSIAMFGICWLVSVDAIAENVEEEAKWLIDVAVSLLRLSHMNWQGHWPLIGELEPHPMNKPTWQNQGIKLQGPKMLAGGAKVPPWYEIDPGVEATTQTPVFKARAAAIFAPSKASLAARVSQGLGWLTRGRQSTDRAERLLYFFTAIEALLSGTDKSAPIVQTIARHAAVMLSNDNAEREMHATKLKALYNLRSALVHNGNRGIDWAAANAAQEYAEWLFYVALNEASLEGKHETFSNALAKASYGVAWPLQC